MDNHKTDTCTVIDLEINVRKGLHIIRWAIPLFISILNSNEKNYDNNVQETIPTIKAR